MPSKRWLRRLLGIILVLAVVWFVGEWMWSRAQDERALATAFAETDAIDPDWRWDKLNAARKQKNLPEWRNGAELLPRIAAQIPGESRRYWPADRFWPLLSTPANTRLPTSTLRQVRSETAWAGSAVASARALKDTPEGHVNIQLSHEWVASEPALSASASDVARLLSWDVILAIEESDANRAIDSLTALQNASRVLGDMPSLFDQLVRMQIRLHAARSLERVLGQSEVVADRLAVLQSAWATDAEEPLLLYAFRGQRAMADVMMEKLTDGTITPQHVLSTEELQKPSSPFAGPTWSRSQSRLAKDRAVYHRYLTQAVEIAKRPPHEQAEEFRKLPPLTEDLPFSRLFLPAVKSTSMAYLRHVADARSVVVGLACERFRLKNGRWPESLAELAPAFLAAVPLDPFDGKPLRYSRQEDGVTVHSVGPKPDPRRTPTFRPGLPDGVEIGFRLWNPEARRQPPPPAKDEELP